MKKIFLVLAAALFGHRLYAIAAGADAGRVHFTHFRAKNRVDLYRLRGETRLNRIYGVLVPLLQNGYAVY